LTWAYTVFIPTWCACGANEVPLIVWAKFIAALAEVANLCAIMAAELGLNVKQAKRAGLLHDIGKVWPEELEKPHAIVGMELAIKYKEHPVICNAIGAHHDEIEMTSIISPIIQACDAISGARLAPDEK